MKNSNTFQIFTSKADTLLALSNKSELCIPASYAFSVEEWEKSQDTVLEKVLDFFSDNKLAVRSSCQKEDNMETSAAGAFVSILNISRSRQELKTAIENVIHSYRVAEKNDQVLVQSMIGNIVVSGVITTRVLADGSPYYVVNYDDESGKTDTITAGSSISKTVYVFRGTAEKDFGSPRLCSFIRLARQVETLCETDALDIEFCLDQAGKLYLLQVRPLCTQKQWIYDVDAHVKKNIDFVSDFVDTRMCRQPELFGSRTILGVMPDWNPAEMIGITPRQLASSLYRNVITSRIWSQARERMGYRSMPPTELMLLIGGRPFIDVRASFNSFLPAGLSSTTGELLVEAWLNRLENHPQFHDKVEFEVAQTALDFCFEKHLDNRYPNLLNPTQKNEFKAALRRLTLACLKTEEGSSLRWALKMSNELQNRQALRHNIEIINTPGQVKNLLDECRNLGTLPFSILARHAFIAESLLRSAVARKALQAERLQDFKYSIQTISGEMVHDFANTCCGLMEQSTFLQRYGHLRPGSYDILSPRYADRHDLFVRKEVPSKPLDVACFTLTEEERRDIHQLLAEAGLETSAEHLLTYARSAIAGREFSKFVFTRNISDVLESLTCWGKSVGLSREDISYLDIRDILEWDTCALLQSPAAYFKKCVEKGRALHALGRGLKLGYLIRSSRDVYIVPQHRSTPNFVGQGDKEAPVCYLHANTSCSVEVQGKIVCIENADPGFDWIFTRNIAGLVTMYGGTNSHMAIRCAEYGLPAAIGVGEQLFTRIISAERCRLNTGACIVQEA